MQEIELAHFYGKSIINIEWSEPNGQVTYVACPFCVSLSNK